MKTAIDVLIAQRMFLANEVERAEGALASARTLLDTREHEFTAARAKLGEVEAALHKLGEGPTAAEASEPQPE